ncbi:MAG: RHS repeat-associated core domain-containing protein [Pyrinomonadaceae bacterium]
MTKLRFAKRFFLLAVCAVAFPFQANAQNAVFVDNFAVGGTSYHYVNGSGTVVQPGTQVYITTKFQLLRHPERILMHSGATVVTADANGRWQTEMPCYIDSTGFYTSYFESHAYVVGVSGDQSSVGGGTSCSYPYDNFANSLVTNSTSTEADRQNLGESCSTDVGRPVNVTNGNMWLRQTDYSLPGIGEALRIDRIYNSSLQTAGLFGVGWRAEYDATVSISNNDLLTLRSGNGRYMYFGGIGSNTYVSASAGIYGQFIKNADSTYTVTFKDGRVQHFDSAGKLAWLRDRNANQTTLNYNGSGILTSVTDAVGRILTLTYETNGAVSQISDALGTIADYEYYPGTSLLKTVTYPDGSKHKFEYTDIVIGGATKTFLTTARDALDNILETHAYDSAGRATTSAVAGGVESYTLDYTNANALLPYTTVTDGLGRVSKYYFDRSKGRSVVTKTEGLCGCGGSGSEVTTFQYDARLNLVKTTDALLNETTYTYNNTGDPLTITDVLGTQSFTYNSFGEVLTHADRMGGGITNSYSGSGNLLTISDAPPQSTGNTTTFAYTAVGRLSSITDARDKTTGFAYDSQGRMTKVTDANSKETTFAYNARAQVTSVTNALSQTTSFQYDANNRLKKITYPDTNAVNIAYDLAGRRSSVTDELGHATTYAYDAAYRLTGITDALNHATAFGYDTMSNLISQTDALGNATNFEYDDFNRLKKIVYPQPSPGVTPLQETITYDKVGNIKTKVDTAGRTTSYDYDAASRRTKITDALSNQTQFTYNASSQMTKVTDSLNQEYTFTYDQFGRALTQTRNGTTTTFTYDAVGNSVTREDYNGDDATYTYDNLNRLTAIAYAGASSENATYTYDDLSRLLTATNQAGTVTFTYDNRNRLKTETDVFNRVLEYGYDAASRRTSLKLGAANYATYAYDNANRLTSLTDPAALNTINFSYDSANRLTSRTYPNGVTTTYEYDGMSRLKRLKDATLLTTLFDRQYSYNSANQISQIAEPSLTRSFGYDNVDRLTSVTGGTSESYAFDAVGNRTSSHLSTSYTTGSFNRLTATNSATYSYNPNGSVIGKSVGTTNWTYGWNRENKMVSASDGSASVSYQFDALGRRVKRTQSVNVEKYTHDGEDVILDDIGGTLTKYQNGPGIDNKLKSTTTLVESYFLADHLGSTNGLTNAVGLVTSSNSYDSFGNATNSAFSSRYQFTGREIDPLSGLNYYRARFHDPNLGRFTSEDPIGFGGGDINLYGYVRNRPLQLRDPRGLQPAVDVLYNPMVWGPIGGAAALAGTAGAILVGGAAGMYGGYHLGEALAQSPWNPVVQGPWPFNPYKPSFGEPYPLIPPLPPSVVRPNSGPACQPMPRSIPWTKSPAIPFPKEPYDDKDECEIQYEADSAICRYLPNAGARGRCWESAMERRVACDKKLPYIPPLITY